MPIFKRNKPLVIVVAHHLQTFRMVEGYFMQMKGWRENLYMVVRSLDDVPIFLIDNNTKPPQGIKKQVLIVAPMHRLTFVQVQIRLQAFCQINPQLELWNYGKRPELGYRCYISQDARDFFHKIALIVDNAYCFSSNELVFDNEGHIVFCT